MSDMGVCLSIFLWCCILGAVLTMVAPERESPRILAWLAAAAQLPLLWGCGQILWGGHVYHMNLWDIPAFGDLTLTVDRLSALFVVVTALVVLPVSIFSDGYLRRYLGHYSLRSFNVLYFALIVSLVLVLISSDVVLFFLSWEAMSILSYLLVNFEHEEERNTKAGYLMLAMSEAGTLAAMLALLMLASAALGLHFSALKSAAGQLGTFARWAVFLLSFFGFGVKAGLVPFSFWLPRAHPVAPGNVSALLSAVILNLGLYGIVRVNMDLLPASLAGTGMVALIVGTVSAFVGILYATTENDLKIMLAHSSIENIGLVTAGLGAGFVFVATGHPALAAIAFTAAFYHMTNHSLYKALLFLGAATVDQRAGTRDLDLLGGLIRCMPWTAACFLVGSLSISALPPFNGFVSEWLTLQTMLRSVELSSIVVKVVFALCGALLALTAALAATCFVKAFAMGFLGMTRSAQSGQAQEGTRSMTAPMVLLAVLCLVLGIVPTYMIAILNGVLEPLIAASSVAALVPPFFASSPGHAQLPSAFASEFHDLGAQVGQHILPGPGLVVLHRGGAENPVVFAMATSYMFPVLLGLLGLTYLVVRYWLAPKRQVTRRPCWDGGMFRLLPEMTYTATGFSNPVRVIFAAILRPNEVEDIRETVATHFRTAIRRQREEVHIVERLVAMPLRYAALKAANFLALMHHGRINSYTAYCLVALIVALVIAANLSP